VNIATIASLIGIRRSALQTGEEAPTIARADRREDRLQDVLDVFEREGPRQKAADESLSAACQRIELQSGEIEKVFNAQRVTDGLDELGRSTVQGYILEAVKSGSLEVAGPKAGPSTSWDSRWNKCRVNCRTGTARQLLATSSGSWFRQLSAVESGSLVFEKSIEYSNCRKVPSNCRTSKSWTAG
jgi:hypothetical protein